MSRCIAHLGSSSQELGACSRAAGALPFGVGHQRTSRRANRHPSNVCSAPCHVASASNRRTRSFCQSLVEPATATTEQEATTSSKSVPQADAWEIDFCSRPLLDERGKKVWELLICDAGRTFEYSEYFPNSKINSVEVGCLHSLLFSLLFFMLPGHAACS